MISSYGIKEVFRLGDVLDKFGHLTKSLCCNYLPTLVEKNDQINRKSTDFCSFLLFRALEGLSIKANKMTTRFLLIWIVK